MKTEEIIKVLDLPEDDQKRWILDYMVKADMRKSGRIARSYTSLADLAFHLRDEVRNLGGDKYFFKGIEVVSHIFSTTFPTIWFTRDAQPIHWIIAALIAKELVNE